MNTKAKRDPGCADKLKTLADSTRLRILHSLMEGPKHVGEINAGIRIEQSLLSHHLKVLRDSGFVCAERDGKAVRYELAPTVRLGAQKRGIRLGCCELVFG